MTGRAALLVAAHRRWLRSGQVVLPSFSVQSWASVDHPGYPYPEAAGLWLGLMAREVRDDRSSVKVAERLGADVSSAGGVGRDGIDYAFDTAVVLAGILAHEASGAPSPLAARLFGFLTRTLGARAPVETPRGPSTHWSQTYGSHLLKTVIAVERFGERTSAEASTALVDQLLADFLPLVHGGRFRTDAASELTYLHGACYAIEGLLWLSSRGRPHLAAVVRDAAAWLAGVQRSHGQLPAWHDGRRGFGEAHADAAAQAVRIWAAVDRAGYEDVIKDALRFLETLTMPQGGVRYATDSQDVNTWCTIFTVQALRWVHEGVVVHELV